MNLVVKFTSQVSRYGASDPVKSLDKAGFTEMRHALHSRRNQCGCVAALQRNAWRILCELNSHTRSTKCCSRQSKRATACCVKTTHELAFSLNRPFRCCACSVSESCTLLQLGWNAQRNAQIVQTAQGVLYLSLLNIPTQNISVSTSICNRFTHFSQWESERVS